VYKELLGYEKELKKQEARIEEMKQDPTKDSHDIKKQVEVLEETQVILPDCRKRLLEAHKKLTEMLVMNDHQ
jgi:tubulin-specific chaperone A